MEKMKPKTYFKTKNIKCDWTDRKMHYNIYMMLNFYVTNGMIVDKILAKISFKQSKWSAKYIKFNTQKRNQAKNDFERDFYNLLKVSFYGKTMENVRNRVKQEFIDKDFFIKIFKQQSKLTWSGIHISFANYDGYTYTQNGILMDKPFYIGFAVLEVSRLLMYETYSDILQP